MRGLETRAPRADHQDVAVCVPHHLALGAPRLRQRAHAGGATDHFLGDLPREPRADERLVVEPHGHHPVERVGDVKQVVLDRGPTVLAPTVMPSRHGAHTPGYRGLAVDGDQAVGAVAGSAVEAAAAVVFQRARERSHPVAIQRRCDRVALDENRPPAFEPIDATVSRLVRAGVSVSVRPRPAAELVEPALLLGAGRVLRQVTRARNPPRGRARRFGRISPPKLNSVGTGARNARRGSIERHGSAFRRSHR